MSLKELLKQENIIVKEITSQNFFYPSLLICVVNEESKNGESFLFFNDESNYSFIGVRFPFKKSDFPDIDKSSLLNWAEILSKKNYCKELLKKGITPTNPTFNEVDFIYFASLIMDNESFAATLEKMLKETEFEELKKLKAFSELPKFEFTEIK